MKAPCPRCGQPNLVTDRECSSCKQSLVRRCPLCAEDISIHATTCRFCGSDLAAPPPPPPATASAPPRLAQFGPVGEERNVALWIVISLVTCGIAGIVWMFYIAGDINRHGGRERLNPVVDLLLAIVTCGLWQLYVMYKYPSTLMDIAREEGGTSSTDVPVLCLVLGLLGLGLVSWAVMQNELNEHWKRHVARA